MASAEMDVQRPSSASAPTLPQLSPQSVKFTATTDFKAKAQERQFAAKERRMRAAAEAPKRTAFLAGLLNQDLQNLTKWHGQRPHHEQKRFLRAVDSVYKGFSKIEGALPAVQARAEREAKAAQQQQAAQIAEAQRILNQDDPYLHIFEQNKRSGMRRTGGASGAGSDTASMASSMASKNGLEKWLDAQSTTTCTTGASSMTEMTSLSQMTRTSSGGFSDCSEPGTHNQMIYRVHRRALAANKRTFNAKNQHAPGYLKDGIPTIGFPECERMATQYGDNYGRNPVGSGDIPKESYASVFKEDRLPFVEQYLDSAPQKEKAHVAGMVRSLNYLRLAHHRNTSCVMRQEMDLAENSRLWKPKRVPQVFRPEQRNLSRVPLGAIGLQGQSSPVPEEIPPPSRSGESVYSPSVSGLGSLPLTPRSMPSARSSVPTPLVGGRDFPMMSAPDTLAPILEAS